MYAEITNRDETGNPSHVYTDAGFCMTSRPYNEDNDVWIEDQLDPSKFLAIRVGRDTEYLVAMVNKLKRENFHLKGELKMWMKASGF